MTDNLETKIFYDFPEVRVRFSKDLLKDNVSSPVGVLTLKEQLHGDNSIYVDSFHQNLLGDGLFTNQRGLPLGVKSADCLPILFYNKSGQVVGAVHAGWRGTEQEIIIKTLRKISSQMYAPFGDYYVFLGPAAQACCYEREFVMENMRQLIGLGVPPDQIEYSGVCTVHSDDLPSHHRQKDDRKESILSIIELV